MGGRDEDGSRTASCESFGVDPMRVDRDINGDHSRAFGGGELVRVPGILEGDRSCALGGEDAGEQGQGLGDAGADDDPFGIGDAATYAAQVGGENDAELLSAEGSAYPS